MKLASAPLQFYSLPSDEEKDSQTGFKFITQSQAVVDSSPIQGDIGEKWPVNEAVSSFTRSKSKFQRGAESGKWVSNVPHK